MATHLLPRTRVPVLRIEHLATCIGPYMDRHGNRLGLSPTADRDHPMFYHEREEWWDRPRGESWMPWVHGFATLDQLVCWFTPNQRRAMVEEGFVLRQYRVPRWALLEGSRQIAFSLPQAQRGRCLEMPMHRRSPRAKSGPTELEAAVAQLQELFADYKGVPKQQEVD